MKLDLIFTTMDICINSSLDPLTKFNGNSRGTKSEYIAL